MKNYVYIYHNNGTREGVSPEEAQQAWGAWFGKLAGKLVDAGNPFNAPGKAVEKTGISSVEKWPATGYSIVKAESLDQAAEMAKGCPVLDEPEGAVRVYEALPM